MVINVVIADDEELFRVGMAYILSRDVNINIMYEASDGKQLITFLKDCTLLPDIIITDIKMPELNGVEATKIISHEYPEVGIVALTTYNTKSFIRNMISVGASAYLVKNSSPEKVLHTIKQVYYKGFYYDNNVMNILNEASTSKSEDDKSVFDENFLTPREREVLELICKQCTTQEIAEQLFISPRTVEVHRKNLLEKTKVKNIAGLVIFAIMNDLIPPIIVE
ncbi:response regulator transcription factor [Ulvibacter litoralis]|uniref:DNA-binding response regulator, NarL/FixJ family, contains REC and HTH domains n=1 Tax=Ulvibacter litoralis TaxID=227084 RepID=A0A1G7HES2_9FLAO|nr:response regulator transcription factor [Ulvibacter litoralis]GHC57433.1 DNA-binding response regulator [Ulvibacter litoralis]SDE98559.1 DNA-binding response regulator, NarL/FixJ family, contains REC and HTH domains [Ulvibacter litoralis]